MLLKAGRAAFIKNLKIYLRKISRVFVVKAVLLLIVHHIWRTYGRQRNIKCLAKNVTKSLADGVVQLAIPCIYMRRTGHNSATVNMFFTEDEQPCRPFMTQWLLVVVFFFVVRSWISSYHLSVAWKPKNAPRFDVRLYDVNWSLVMTLLLDDCRYQTSGEKDLWPKQNHTLLVILVWSTKLENRFHEELNKFKGK